MIIGVSRETLQRNIVHFLYSLLNWPTPGNKTVEVKIWGRRVFFVGANDEGATRKIQGSTLAMAYVDELTCIPQPFFRMLLSRLSVPGAKLFATMNPEGPSHWVKKEYIDRSSELDINYWNFTLDDNPVLDEAYKANLKREYTGSWYRRYILGEWAMASGAVFPDFDELNQYVEPKNNPVFYIVGIDYGTTNPTCALIAAVNPHQWPQISIVSEYYYDSVVSGRQKTDAELADDIKEFLSIYPIRTIYVDPAAASFKLELRNKDLPVVDANNDVLLGIKLASKFVSNKNLVVHKSCTNLIDQIQSYAWDPKAADRGEDKPIKMNDHACVTGNTLVQTSQGELTIEFLATHAMSFYLMNFNGKEIVEDACFRAKKTKKLAEVWEIELEDGKKLKATPDHKFLTQRGYIPLCELTLSDTILTWNTK